MSNRPNSTAHLYEISEITSMHQKAIRLGRIRDAVFATIERDVSAHGNAAFSTNFISATEDVGIASPTSVLVTLICYNKWYNIMKSKFKGSTGKSHTVPEARKYLIATSVFLTRAMKSRLEPDASVVSIKNTLKQVMQMDPEAFETNTKVEAACTWVSTLGPANGVTGKDNVGIDIAKVIKLFVIFLSKTAEVWTKIAKKRTHEKKQADNPSDPSIDKEALDDPEADEQRVVILETNLLMLAQVIYAVDTYEKRRLPKGKKPDFITKALAEFPPTWQAEFPKIGGKSEKMFARPIAWIFAPLLELAYQMHPAKKNGMVLVLLGLLEMCAKEVGNDRANFLTAILFVVRCKTLNLKNVEINPDDIIQETEISELMKLYDECKPGSEDCANPELLVRRRQLTVAPEYLDRTTFRGKGKDTAPVLDKGATAIPVDISGWSTEERSKSHGAGIVHSKKQSDGVPTYMSEYLESGVRLAADRDLLDNPYKEKAKEILMKEEEAHGHEKANEKEMAVRRYPSWVGAFPIKLPDRQDDDGQQPQQQEEDQEENTSSATTRTTTNREGLDASIEVADSRNRQHNKKKPMTSSSSSKNHKNNNSNHKNGGTSRNKLTATTNKNSNKSSGRQQSHQDEEEEEESDEEVIIVRKTRSNSSSSHLSNLAPGKLIRIKTIIYESADEDELQQQQEEEDTVRTRVTLQKSRSKAIVNKGKEEESQSDHDDNCSDGEEGDRNESHQESGSDEPSSAPVSKNKRKRPSVSTTTTTTKTRKAVSTTQKKNNLPKKKKSDDAAHTVTKDNNVSDNEDSTVSPMDCDNDNDNDNDEEDSTTATTTNNSNKRKVSSSSSANKQGDGSGKQQSKAKKAKVDVAKFDLLKALNSSIRVLSEEEVEQLLKAPLAQRPTGNAKKFVYVTKNTVYKGPYNPELGKDVEAIQRVLYRTFRMKTQWKDTILMENELVYDNKNKMLYLCSNNVASHVLSEPNEWKVETTTLKTHDGKQVDIISRDSSGVVLLSKAIQTTSNVDALIVPAMLNLAARYLIGSGGGHFGEIILATNNSGINGSGMSAVDIEDNREKVPPHSDTPSPTLLDLLFVNKKQPARSNDKFYQSLSLLFEPLQEFIETVKKEDISASVAYATGIGYTGAPPQQTIQRRLDLLQACLHTEKEHHKNFKTNGSGIPEMPIYDETSETTTTTTTTTNGETMDSNNSNNNNNNNDEDVTDDNTATQKVAVSAV